MKLRSSMIRDIWRSVKLSYTVARIRSSNLIPEKKAPASFSRTAIKNIIVIRLDKVGDLVLSTPVFANLKKSVPSARITALVRGYNAGVLKNNPNVDRIVIFEDKEALKKLYSEETDLAINLIYDFDLESALACYNSKALFRVGYKHPRSSYFYNVAIERNLVPGYELMRNLEILAALGLDISIKESALYPSSADKLYCTEELAKLGIGPEEVLIGLNPGTGRKRRVWPAEKYILLGKELLKRPGIKLLVFWGNADRLVAEKVVQGIGKGALLAPKTDIAGLAEILKRLKVFVCGNTGPAHVAIAMKTPLVGLYGKNDYQNWTPSDKTGVTVLEAEKCSAIEVTDVLKGVVKLL